MISKQLAASLQRAGLHRGRLHARVVRACKRDARDETLTPPLRVRLPVSHAHDQCCRRAALDNAELPLARAYAAAEPPKDRDAQSSHGGRRVAQHRSEQRQRRRRGVAACVAVHREVEQRARALHRDELMLWPALRGPHSIL
eukprot:6198797-Pleurochrysis_carterae.AAC.2